MRICKKPNDFDVFKIEHFLAHRPMSGSVRRKGEGKEDHLADTHQKRRLSLHFYENIKMPGRPGNENYNRFRERMLCTWKKTFFKLASHLLYGNCESEKRWHNKKNRKTVGN